MAGPYPSARVQIGICLICVVSTYSNGGVQIWVGMELSEHTICHTIIACTFTFELYFKQERIWNTQNSTYTTHTYFL